MNEAAPTAAAPLPARDVGLRVRGVGLRVRGVGLRVRGVGLRAGGVGLRVRGVGLRVRGTVARVRESGPVPSTEGSNGPVDEPAQPGPDRVERLGRIGVAAITGIVALTWFPLLSMPFGDNHLGRIIGRYALHLRNLQEQGILGSHFGADWLPYASTPYAHHPPLLNLLTALTGLLPGDGEYQVWLPAYLLALLIVPAGAALLRGLGLRWSATLLALGLMVATPFYWIYSPLMFDLGPILALSALVVRLRARPDPSRRLVAGACVAALLTTLVSWPGVGFAAVLGLWLLAARRVDRVTVLVGASMLTGVAISLAYVVGVTGMAMLGGQAELRSTGGGFTVRQFLRQQWRYAYDLLPLWYIGALPVGAVVGLLDRRTRVYLAMAVAFTAVWILGLRNGAYVHSYWSYPMLVVGLVAMGVLLDRLVDGLTRRVPEDGLDAPARKRDGTGRSAVSRRFVRTGRRLACRPVRVTAATLVGAALGAYLGMLVVGPDRHRLLDEPAAAGRLVSEHPPPAGQRYAWTVGTGAASPRWLAYYWRLKPRPLSPATLHTEPTRPEDLVLIDLTRRPEWLPGSVETGIVARDGRYALLRVATLHSPADAP